MEERSRKHIEEVTARLFSRATSGLRVAAVYLFGSHARGEATAASDVDLAVLFDRAPQTFDEYPFDLAADLEQAIGVHVDLVVLNTAPSDLVHRVLRDGVLLVERDRSARVRFEVRSRSDYFDMLPIRNEYRRRGRGVMS